jgi:hypothetical protein
MLVTLGWMLLGGFPPVGTTTDQDVPRSAQVAAAGRISVWTDRDDPYTSGEAADVFLNVDEPSYIAVFRVDTDGRIRVLFPREPWSDTHVWERRELQVGGPRGGRSFLVDDDPGVGYLLAVASPAPLDLRSITRGDDWDYRLIDGGRIQGDPYVRLSDLAARLVPDGDYDYDISPYYVGRRYDYPRFVCYDCHAYASYREWDPYHSSCTRYRVVVRDDPDYYPYHYGGRNVVAVRPAHPSPRFVFHDVDPRRPAVSPGESERRRDADDGPSRTSADVGGPGAVPAPYIQSLRRRKAEPAEGPDHPRQPREAGDSSHDVPTGLRPASTPRSTGEPELRRRSP